MGLLHPATKLTDAARRTFGDVGHPIILSLIQEVERQAFMIEKVCEFVGKPTALMTHEKCERFDQIRDLVYGEQR